MAQMKIQVPINYEPKKNNRFVLEFPEGIIESWLVRTSDMPSITQKAVEIPYMNTSTFVLGRYIWNTLTIKFIDPIGPSASMKLMEWIRLHSESITGRQGYAFGYKKNLVLKMLDPTGVEIEKWVLYGCQITEAKFGSNDYNDDEVKMPEITIQPDWCELEY